MDADLTARLRSALADLAAVADILSVFVALKRAGRREDGMSLLLKAREAAFEDGRVEDHTELERLIHKEQDIDLAAEHDAAWDQHIREMQGRHDGELVGNDICDGPCCDHEREGSPACLVCGRKDIDHNEALVGCCSDCEPEPMSRQLLMWNAGRPELATVGGLVVDLFAGGGGASKGLELALGRSPDYAINHNPIAIAVHKANHPTTHHLTSNVWEVEPETVTRGRPVDVLWASPDCKHFSSAKGGKPREQSIRSLAWVIVRWAARARPRIIVVENVREFQSWGPLNEQGRPIRRLNGSEFSRWVEALEAEGYAVEWRVLDASAYGAPTRRLRLFVVARCDGQAIEWPDPTHGPGLERVRTAAECIDWSIPVPSIFERKRPLRPKTLWRIAEGLRRFVIESPNPYIVHEDGRTGAAALVQTGYGERKGQRARTLDIEAPLGTVVAGGQKHALVAAWLSKHYGGVVGHGVDRPASTITAKDHHALTTARLERDDGAGPHRVRAFLAKYYGTAVGQSLNDPLHTITAKDRMGLVTIQGEDFTIADIGMRMLQPLELLRAQFGEHADGYTLEATKRVNGKPRPLSKADKVRLVGNSVCPHVAAAVLRAQF